MTIATLKSDQLERALFIAFGWACAIVPIVYFHNGLVTEYYFSKTIWANLFIPLPILIYFAVSLRDERLVFPKSRTLLPLAVFIGWAALSISWTTNPYKSIELIGKVGAGPAAFIGTLLFVNTRARVQGFIYLALWTTTIVVVYGFFQYFEVLYLPKDQYGNADPSTTIGLTNFVVEYLILFLLSAPLLAILEERRWVRGLLLVSFVFTFTYLLISNNRAGMLGFVGQVILLCSILIWIVRRNSQGAKVTSKQVMGAIAAVLVGVMFVLGGTGTGRKVVDRFASITEPAATEAGQELDVVETFLLRIRRDASIRFRIETWYQCLKNMFPDNPAMGVGLANLEVEFPRYYTNFLEGMTLRNNTRVVRSHNEFVQVLSDLGIIGFIFLIWLLTQVVRTAYEGLLYCRNRKDYILWLALNLGFVGYGIEMFFAFPMQVPTSSIFFFIAMGLSTAYTHTLRAAAEDDASKSSTSDCYVINFDEPWQKPAVFGSLVVASGLVLALENFTYNALVGEVRNKEARVYKRYKKWDEAYKLLSDAINHYPWMEGYYYDRAVVQMQRKELDTALDDLRQTAKLVPNYAMGRKQIGMLASRINKTELAVSEFKQTMKIYKRQREELTDLIARTALKGRRPDLAIPVLEETLAMDIEFKNKQQLYRLLADGYGMRGDAENSLKMFEKLKEYGAWDINIRIRNALALAQTNRVSEAEEQIRIVLSEKPNIAEARYALGRILNAQQKYPEARIELEQAVAIDPKLRKKVKADKVLRTDPDLKSWIKSL